MKKVGMQKEKSKNKKQKKIYERLIVVMMLNDRYNNYKL